MELSGEWAAGELSRGRGEGPRCSLIEGAPTCLGQRTPILPHCKEDGAGEDGRWWVCSKGLLIPGLT